MLLVIRLGDTMPAVCELLGDGKEVGAATMTRRLFDGVRSIQIGEVESFKLGTSRNSAYSI